MKVIKKIKEQKDIRLINSDSLLKNIIPYLKNEEIYINDVVTLLFINNQIVELNVIGSIIWDKIKKEYSKEKIINDIKKEFNAPLDEISIDVNDFLNILFIKKIIEF